MDINPKSYHLTAFELINQLHYINFPSFESTLSSSVALSFRNLPNDKNCQQKNFLKNCLHNIGKIGKSFLLQSA